MQITYQPKKGTTTVFLGSDGKEYRLCKKDGTYYIGVCPICTAKKEAERIELLKIKQEKELAREKRLLREEADKQRRKEFSEGKKNVKFFVLWKHYQSLIESIKDLINIGFSNDMIMAAFFNERNPPYDLSNNKKEYLLQIPPFGTVLEHINGRETIGYYCVYAILIGDINNPQELEKFYLKYCGQIKTDADFNNKIIKKYQNDDGAISPEMYMEVLEKEKDIVLTPDEKEYFRSKFLYSTYGKLFKNDVLNVIRNGTKA